MNSWYRAGVVILLCDGHFGTPEKYVFQPDVAVAKRDQVAKHLKSRLLHTPARLHLSASWAVLASTCTIAPVLSSSNHHPAF